MERLKVLELFSTFGRLLRADLVICWKIFHSEMDIGLSDGFTLTDDQRTREHSVKVVVPRCELEMRKNFFSCKGYSSMEFLI